MSNRRRHAEERLRQQRRQRFAFAGAVAALVAIALAVAIAAGGGDDDSVPAAPETRPVTVTGGALARFDPAAPDAAIGATIPSVTGADFTGHPVQVAANGKAKVVLFLAHWCPHCRKEVPLLAPDLRANPLPDSVEFVAVSTAVNRNAPNYPPSKWLADAEWPTPVLLDDDASSTAAAFGLSGYPFFVFADADNRVVSRFSGEMPLDAFRAAVDALASR